uniref:substrate-binding domain-containing protein n=1 Tax=Pedobacter schmidteae TaxID=2201271 RepID=UPI000EAC67A7|nr:substrate-binding domain-containing protein [Pedobacter schmidteae]
MKNIRIKDIAAKAKVSAGTVDRVLHDRGNVSEKVKERILQIIEEMNYEPNLMARALGTKKEYHFAALIGDPRYDAYWLDPKSGIQKAAKEARQYGVKVTLYMFNPYDPGSFVKKAEEVTRTNPDGILLAPMFYREVLPFFEAWKTQEIPFVLFNTQIAEADPLSYIGQDSYQSGQVAGKLIHYGQSQGSSVLIAHIDEEISNSAHLTKKEQGLRNYFIQNKLDHQYEIIKAELNLRNYALFVEQLDAIFESNPQLQFCFVTTSKAFEIAKYFEQKFINHIKIIGYDLIPQNLHYLNKGSISFLINQNPLGQGYWGINQLLDHLVLKKEISAIKFLPLDIVTKENLNYYIDDSLLYNRF